MHTSQHKNARHSVLQWNLDMVCSVLAQSLIVDASLPLCGQNVPSSAELLHLLVRQRTRSHRSHAVRKQAACHYPAQNIRCTLTLTPSMTGNFAVQIGSPDNGPVWKMD
jgi:hypothetical protein